MFFASDNWAGAADEIAASLHKHSTGFSPAYGASDLDKRLEGARFTELSAKHKQQNITGVLIDDLQARSRLVREGLAEGDIIVGVNRERVHNLEDFSEGLGKTRGSILLQINRGGRTYVARID